MTETFVFRLFASPSLLLYAHFGAEIGGSAFEKLLMPTVKHGRRQNVLFSQIPHGYLIDLVLPQNGNLLFRCVMFAFFCHSRLRRNKNILENIQPSDAYKYKQIVFDAWKIGRLEAMTKEHQ